MLPSPLVVFTEPLGTLVIVGRPIEAAAEEALAELERRKIPLVFASRGTRMELEFFRRRIGNQHPMITESGGGLFLPHGYFSQRLEGATNLREYHCIAFGRPYEEITAALEKLAAEAGVEVAGFHQMSAREVAENSGLPTKVAQLARQREFDEPFFFAGASDGEIARFCDLARARGFDCWRGDRFWHFSSGTNTARAVRRLMDLYRAARRARLRSVGIGFRRSELALLCSTSLAVVLPQPSGGFDEELLARLPSAKRGHAPGPAGWNQAVLSLFEE